MKLGDLYENKKVTDNRFKSNPFIVKQFIKTVNKLKASTRIEQLYQFSGLHYETLSGDRKGQSSVRINEQYRLIFEEIKQGEEVVLLELIEISKHYE